MPKVADLRAVGEVAASRYGVVTSEQAARFDISRRVLDRLSRDGVLARHRPNVYRFTSHPVTWQQSLYLATVARPAVADRLSASAVHGLDGYAVPPSRPNISCRYEARVHDASCEVHVSRSLPADDIIDVAGIPCTTLARTVIDLRPIVGHLGMIRMLDDLERRGASMRWVLERAELLLANGRSGARDVADETRRRMSGDRVPDSWFERLLEECLRSPILTGIERQYVLRDRHGDFVARLDLAIPWVRLGIEAHSRMWHQGWLPEAYDEDRDMRITKCGWDVQYLGFAATRSPARVRADIEAIVVRRSIDFGLTAPAPSVSRIDAG